MKSINSKGIKAAITAVSGYVPSDVLSNTDLEKMVDTNDEWIVTRTGIKERRIARNPLEPTSFLAIQAAKQLLEKKNLDPSTIDLVIVATATPDMQVVATAAYVATQIGAHNAFGFDLQAACSGFLYGMSTAASYIESGRYKKVLLIGADKMSSIVDYTDRATCIIFGDGAGAVLFEPSENEYGFEDSYLRSDGSGRDFLAIKSGGSLYPFDENTYEEGGHNIKQDGQTVFKNAVKNMADAAEKLMTQNDLTGDQIAYLLPHQANKRIIDATARRINLPEDRVLMNIEKYGNTTAATLPLLISDFESKFSKGDKLVFAAFGAGFTWGAVYLTWNYDYNN
ncbi:ketoacyl-ACP synthase III [Flavobacteriaceae bacterium]|mgnify:CR=1 FL=1|jgi:3-oxoacyl-[acyl-carrier-protein] synthase-3|uniref:beta-ketoacyl-ACP synthase III n=1 Tax=Candidatus Arcticimaribacter forsetii TaxID=2820661 RepID=UPI002077750E|nr:beta-ketoacyl-ACP synthase III [Candidatus Arcticimaribacter forsetii]MCH1538625.1 ketoacyl-ACP synthase III [Flavobacteriaceae bacterium]MDA8639867.1 ketoacyl-ACP synthase III [Flavobacteriaceae bacterium]MDA8698515.1 ketoacyl-ACP synthase III [Flavobacteriaceae bacterium]MDB2329821.1 ketoacyl-ACP synthase III [Flavobacteriaceae bacterium]MDB2456610.1 ketoacyl-ACP synthase III [Flavobacteriaceae bacterium]